MGTSDTSLSEKGRLMDSRNGNSKGIERTRENVSRRVASPFRRKRRSNPLCSIVDGKVNFSKKIEMKKKHRSILSLQVKLLVLSNVKIYMYITEQIIRDTFHFIEDTGMELEK